MPHRALMVMRTAWNSTSCPELILRIIGAPSSATATAAPLAAGGSMFQNLFQDDFLHICRPIDACRNYPKQVIRCFLVRSGMGIQQHPAKIGNFTAALRAASTAASASDDDLIQRKRELVADLCRLLGRRMANVTSPGKPLTYSRQRSSADIPIQMVALLSPRMRQTLDGLLAGDSGKQIAHKLSLSRHTIHVYVKALYKGFGVSSRGELLARFIHVNLRTET